MAQLMTTTVGALPTADDDGVSLSQKSVGGRPLVLNGTFATGTFAAASICASQTPSGSGALTINGTLAQTNPVAGAGGTASAPSALVRFPSPVYVYITGGSDESAKNFTITGTIQAPGTFGPGIVVAETLAGPNASTTATTKQFTTITSVTVDAATTGAVTVGHFGLSPGATLDATRRLDITSGGNDTGITFAVAGLSISGDPQSETVTGASGGAASTVLSYSTVTSVIPSGAVATTVKVGTSAVADSQWLYFDRLAGNAQVALQVEGSGTVNWTVQQTLDDITIPAQGSNLPTVSNIWTPATVKWVNHPDSALVASTTTTGVQGNYAYTPAMCRITLNSGTGTVRLTTIQATMR